MIFLNKVLGYFTDSVFQRYNLVTEEEMKGMKWLGQEEGEIGMMDSYMDT